MKKPHFPFILIGILVLGFAFANVLGLILAALGLGAAYFLSLRLHPRIRHGRCNGTGEHRGAIFTWVHRRCGGCQGGRLIRWGAGRWGAGHIQSEYVRTKRARAEAKQGHVWR